MSSTMYRDFRNRRWSTSWGWTTTRKGNRNETGMALCQWISPCCFLFEENKRTEWISWTFDCRSWLRSKDQTNRQGICSFAKRFANPTIISTITYGVDFSNNEQKYILALFVCHRTNGEETHRQRAIPVPLRFPPVHAKDFRGEYMGTSRKTFRVLFILKTCSILNFENVLLLVGGRCA